MCCHLKGNADTEDKNGQRCVPPLLVASAHPTRHHFNVIKNTEEQKYRNTKYLPPLMLVASAQTGSISLQYCKYIILKHFHLIFLCQMYFKVFIKVFLVFIHHHCHFQRTLWFSCSIASLVIKCI